MKYFLFIIYFILQMGCSACAPTHTPVVQIDPAFQTYVAQWHQDAIATLGHDVPIQDLKMQFADLSGAGEGGLCTMDFNSTPLIQIDQAFWTAQLATGNDTYNLSIIYHELGHCILSRPQHNNTIISVPMSPGSTMVTNVFESIMNYHGYVSGGQWEYYKQNLLTEYFSTVEKPE